MSVNRNAPHVLVLPEDDANRQIANGFQQQVALTRQRRMQVLPVAGGWNKVLSHFKSDHVLAMDCCPRRFMLLLIDFDGKADRLKYVKEAIPERLAGRVFVLGAWTEPENLKDRLGAYETIGAAMAMDCREGTDTTWGHMLLQHNAREIDRLREHVRPFLF